jgi:RNA polymerase sigma factor (sigma-70 family)
MLRNMLRRARSIRPESELPPQWEAVLRPVFGRYFSVGSPRRPSGLARADALAQSRLIPELGRRGPQRTEIQARKPLTGRNLLARMGFQKIWQRWSLAVRRWVRAFGSSARRGPGAAVPALGSNWTPKATQPLCCGWLRATKPGSITSQQKYHRPMIHFLYRMVGNQAVAEELAQEVFLRVYRARSSYRAEARFTTWLYRIATNLAVNHARDTRHERSAQTVYLDQPDEESGTTPDVADDEPTAEQQLLRDERMAAIRRHVMALPERQRTAVLMHKYQGMDYRQIGDVLKLSESATKSLLFRAYQTLRDKLKDFV